MFCFADAIRAVFHEVVFGRRTGDQETKPLVRVSSRIHVWVKDGVVVDKTGLTGIRLIEGPDWIRTNRFEINARAVGDVSAVQMRLMVQSLLEERFSLRLHKEPRRMRVARLILNDQGGRLGPGLSKCNSDTPERPTKVLIPRGGFPLNGRCQPITALAVFASGLLQTPVVDRTGLDGLWSYDLVFAPPQPSTPVLSDPTHVPEFSTALREQLGIRLESSVGSVDVVVIDSVTQPTEN
jgi:uncharacterized protein (TIGR03435 family)